MKKAIITLKRPLEVRVYRASDGSERDSYNARVKGIEGDIEDRLDGGLNVLAHTGTIAGADVHSHGTLPVSLAANYSEEARRLYHQAEVERLRLRELGDAASEEERRAMADAFRTIRGMPNEQLLSRTLIVVPAGNIDGVQYL